MERYVQAAAHDGDIRLRLQPLLDAPAADIGERRLGTDRQDILRLADAALPVEAAAGDQDVGLAGQFLVQAPVTRVGDGRRNGVRAAAALSNGNSAIQRGDEIAVDIG